MTFSNYPLHAGQYKHLKDAEGYAARLREIGPGRDPGSNDV